MNAHEAIRDAAHRYSRGVDRLDADLMKSAYWPDAIDDHGVFVGNAMAFCDRVVASHGRFTATMHCILNHAITLDGEDHHGPDESDGPETAHGEVYNVTYLHRTDDEGQRWLDTWWGRYLDRYERRELPGGGEDWRIAQRTCVHEWTRSERVEAAMPITADQFRQGSVDRGTSTPLGR